MLPRNCLLKLEANLTVAEPKQCLVGDYGILMNLYKLQGNKSQAKDITDEYWDP